MLICYILFSRVKSKNDSLGMSREQFFTMQANESVLMTTVEDQQLKIKEYNIYVHVQYYRAINDNAVVTSTTQLHIHAD